MHVMQLVLLITKRLTAPRRPRPPTAGLTLPLAPACRERGVDGRGRGGVLPGGPCGRPDAQGGGRALVVPHAQPRGRADGGYVPGGVSMGLQGGRSARGGACAWLHACHCRAPGPRPPASPPGISQLCCPLLVLPAGYYNTDERDGYGAILQLCAVSPVLVPPPRLPCRRPPGPSPPGSTPGAPTAKWLQRRCGQPLCCPPLPALMATLLSWLPCSHGCLALTVALLPWLLQRHGVGLTLTCVEMCDAQHPPEALCGPEGLLRQVGHPPGQAESGREVPLSRGPCLAEPAPLLRFPACKTWSLAALKCCMCGWRCSTIRCRAL